MLLETPKTYSVYIIAGEEFKRKADIINRARELFGEWKPNRPALDGKARKGITQVVLNWTFALLKHT
jgi:hypothetical protein